jgi:hypothetical protein
MLEPNFEEADGLGINYYYYTLKNIRMVLI